jgi:hypothetical protein
MKPLKALVTLFAMAIMAAVSCGACATTSTTDYSDQWWNGGESGWGASMLQQGDVIFVDLFVYGADGKSTWFVAGAARQAGPADTFVGDLYATTGPGFALPTFDPAQVVGQKVGTLTFAAHDAISATLTYTVNASTVMKQVTRQTWRTNPISGTYLGGFPGVLSGCGLQNGPKVETGTIIVTQTDMTLGVASNTNVRLCTLNGDYQQSGRMGKSTGTFICREPAGTLFGTYTMSEIEAGVSGMTMKVVQHYDGTGCTYDGRIGGVRN